MLQLQQSQQLTEQQKSFCQGILEGLSPAESYLRTYRCKKSASSASATRLLKTAKVSEHLNRLRGISESRSILDRLQKLELLTEMALREGRYSDASVSDARSAISTHNKMTGDEAPQQMLVASFNLADLLSGDSTTAPALGWSDYREDEDPADAVA